MDAKHLRIEMDRGHGWELRAEGNVPASDISDVGLRAQLRDYALQYPHRAVVDGEIVMTAQPRMKRGG